jgi:cysteine-rich repeat protein
VRGVERHATWGSRQRELRRRVHHLARRLLHARRTRRRPRVSTSRRTSRRAPKPAPRAASRHARSSSCSSVLLGSRWHALAPWRRARPRFRARSLRRRCRARASRDRASACCVASARVRGRPVLQCEITLIGSMATLRAFDARSLCRTNCTVPARGDGILDGGEVCDDGNTVPGDGCAADCTGSDEDARTDGGGARHGRYRGGSRATSA